VRHSANSGVFWTLANSQRSSKATEIENPSLSLSLFLSFLLSFFSFFLAPSVFIFFLPPVTRAVSAQIEILTSDLLATSSSCRRVTLTTSPCGTCGRPRRRSQPGKNDGHHVTALSWLRFLAFCHFPRRRIIDRRSERVRSEISRRKLCFARYR